MVHSNKEATFGYYERHDNRNEALARMRWVCKGGRGMYMCESMTFGGFLDFFFAKGFGLSDVLP